MCYPPTAPLGRPDPLVSRLSSLRYVGEIVTDAEADKRENDSFLFTLDNKVRSRDHAGRRSTWEGLGIVGRHQARSTQGKPEWLEDLFAVSACMMAVPRIQRRESLLSWRDSLVLFNVDNTDVYG